MSSSQVLPSPTIVRRAELRQRASNCGLLILASGFEDRALTVLRSLRGDVPQRTILISFPEGTAENDAAAKEMGERISGTTSDHERITFDPYQPEPFITNLRDTLYRWGPDTFGEIWLDISGLPMHGICIVLALVRQRFSNPVRVLYTEANEYYPKRSETSIAADQPPAALSKEMAANVIPSIFAGSATDSLTCLVVFAGYERHRVVGIVDELNPSKLVLVYGRPEREELDWRLGWSERLHRDLATMRPTSSEVVSTLDPLQSLTVLREYYDYLFEDHNFVIAPVCSKMQAVAASLFWERFRDVQLAFPVPVAYLPGRFSRGARSTFEWLVPPANQIAEFYRLSL